MKKQHESDTAIPRSELWLKIYEIVVQIPQEQCIGDSMDKPSATTLIEQLIIERKGVQWINVSDDMPDDIELVWIRGDAEGLSPTYGWYLEETGEWKDYIGMRLTHVKEWAKIEEPLNY